MYKKMISSSLLAGTLLAMNGCGGGSSSSDITTGTTEKAVLSGVAVDDLILDGVVQAKDTAENLLTEGRTSETDGRYTLNVAHTGVVLVNVTCDEDSSMYNPVTTTTTVCGSDVNLNSITTVDEAGQEVTVNISPLTEIVYQRALAEAGDSVSAITEDDFDTARAEIGVMLGLDPIADNPLVDTYADIIDVIHTMAEESGTSVMEVTDALAEELSDGSADGEDIIMDFVAAMDEVNIINNLVENNGIYTPPENPAQLSDIDAAKALFTELRTQAMSVTDYTNSGTPGFLDTEALSMEQAFNGVVMDVSLMSNILGELNGAIKYAIDSNQDSEGRIIYNTNYAIIVTKNTITSWDYQILDLDASAPEWGGSVSYPDFDTNDIFNFTTLTANVSGNMPLGSTTVTDPNIVDSQSFNGSIITNKTTDGATFEIAGAIASNGTSVTLSNMTGEIAYDEDTTTGEAILNYFKLNGVTLQGIVDGYTIDGSIAVNSYVQNAGLSDLGGIVEEYYSELSVQVNCPTSTLNISNVSFAYDTVTYTPNSTNIYDTNAWFNFYDISGDLQYDEVQSNLAYTATCSNGETVDVNYQVWENSDTMVANSGWLPNDITFAGAISRTGASIEGTLNAKWLNAATMDMESDVETPLVDVTLNGKLQMPERPEMLMTLTFENSATQNILGASYTYGTTVINAEGVFDTDMVNGDVAITTHTGLRADIKISDSSDDIIEYGGVSTVTKDGLLIGNFEDREGLPVVKYIDGSFESIF